MADFMNFFGTMFPVLAVVVLVAVGIICIFFAKNKASIKNSPILTRYGTIIEKTPGTYERIIVEFEDGKRESLVDLKHSTLYTVGDKGIFKTQKHTIISFDRQ